MYCPFHLLFVTQSVCGILPYHRVYDLLHAFAEKSIHLISLLAAVNTFVCTSVLAASDMVIVSSSLMTISTSSCTSMSRLLVRFRSSWKNSIKPNIVEAQLTLYKLIAPFLLLRDIFWIKKSLSIPRDVSVICITCHACSPDCSVVNVALIVGLEYALISALALVLASSYVNMLVSVINDPSYTPLPHASAFIAAIDAGLDTLTLIGWYGLYLLRNTDHFGKMSSLARKTFFSLKLKR